MTQQDAARAGLEALKAEIRREPLRQRLVRAKAMIALMALEQRGPNAQPLTPENEALFLEVTLADAAEAGLDTE